MTLLTRYQRIHVPTQNARKGPQNTNIVNWDHLPDLTDCLAKRFRKYVWQAPLKHPRRSDCISHFNLTLKCFSLSCKIKAQGNNNTNKHHKKTHEKARVRSHKTHNQHLNNQVNLDFQKFKTKTKASTVGFFFPPSLKPIRQPLYINNQRVGRR